MKNLTRHLTVTAALLVMGCGSDEAAFFQGNPGQPPVAVADTFTVLGNSVLTGVVTANDTPNSGTVSSFQVTSALGGTVSVNPVGQFSYTPPLNQNNVSDTFTYTLSNNVGNSTATVTIQIGARGLFVKNDVATTGNGSQSSPFKTLAEAVAAASGVSGAQIVLFRGDGSTTGLNGSVPLGANQGISSFDAASPANITGPVAPTSNNSIRNLRFSAAAGAAVTANVCSNLTLTGLQIESRVGNGVNLSRCTGNLNVSNTSLRDLTGIGMVVASDSGNLVWSVNNCVFTNVAGRGINTVTTDTASHNVTVTNVTCTGSGGGEFVSVDATGTGNVGLTVNNTSMDGDGTRTRGVGILGTNTARVVALLSANNITGCTDTGILLVAADNANLKARITGNLLNGNAGKNSLTGTAAGNANLGLIMENNLGELFSLLQAATSTVTVQNRDQFNTASNNTGTLVQAGTIGDGPVTIP